MIVLKSLKAKNFKSWKNLEIDNIDEMGLTLINAKNGFGKSSIRNAIEYLLLDTFSEPMNVEDIPYNKDTECIIEGVFKKEDDEIKIIKYRNHKKRGQSIELLLNDDDSLTHTDRRETQKEILRLFDIDLFTVQTTSIYSSSSKSFIESTDTEKKEIVYNVLDLHKYTKGKEKAKQKIKELSDSIEKSEAIVKTINETITTQETDLEDVGEQIAEYDVNKKQKIESLKSSIKAIVYESTTELEATVKDLESKKEDEDTNKLNLLKDIDSKLTNDKLEKEIELKSLIETIRLQKIELVDVTDKLNNYESNKQITIKNLTESLENCKQDDSFTDLEKEILELERSKIFIDEDAIYILKGDLEEYQNIKLKKEIELKNNRIKLKDAGDGICPVLKNFHCEHLIDQRDSIIESCEPVIEFLERDIDGLEGNIVGASEELEFYSNDIQFNEETDYMIKTLEYKINERKTNNLINKNKTEDINKTIENLKAEINPYIDIKNNINIPEDSAIDVINNEIESLKTKLLKVEQETLAIVKVQELNSIVDLRIKIAKDKISEIETDNKIKLNNVQGIEYTIDFLKMEHNPHITFKKKIVKAIKINKDKIVSAESKCSQIFEEMLYIKFWYKGFGKTGLPNMLSENFLISLEDETNKILSSISDQMHITISSQKENKDKSISEKIDVQIHHPDKKITSVGAYSAGQRQRVKLSNLFALHNLISNLDFMILDESLEGSLDQEGKEGVIELLKSQAKDIGTILVISHDDTVKDSFTNVIDIGMEDGVSCIKED